MWEGKINPLTFLGVPVCGRDGPPVPPGRLQPEQALRRRPVLLLRRCRPLPRPPPPRLKRGEVHGEGEVGGLPLQEPRQGHSGKKRGLYLYSAAHIFLFKVWKCCRHSEKSLCRYALVAFAEDLQHQLDVLCRIKLLQLFPRHF